MTTIRKPRHRGRRIGFMHCIVTDLHTRRFNCCKEERKTRKQALFTKRRAKVNSLGTMQWNSFRLRTGRCRTGASTWTFLLCGPLWEGSCQLFRSAFCPEAQSSNSSGNTISLIGLPELPNCFLNGRTKKKGTQSRLMFHQHPVRSSWVETRKWKEWSWISTGWTQMAGGDS